tara:strand:- start:1192 stop:1596 length:405 start_codon:yes stop_codon:yes gene_type:complete
MSGRLGTLSQRSALSKKKYPTSTVVSPLITPPNTRVARSNIRGGLRRKRHTSSKYILENIKKKSLRNTFAYKSKTNRCKMNSDCISGFVCKNGRCKENDGIVKIGNKQGTTLIGVYLNVLGLDKNFTPLKLRGK